MTVSIFSIPLAREIAIVLLLKIIVLLAIKWAFFSDPVDMAEPQNNISRQLGLQLAKPSSEGESL